METLQTPNEREIRKLLLYLQTFWLGGEQLAHWTFVGKSKSGSLLEVRLPSLETTVLRLQHKQRRNGSRLLQKNVRRNRATKNVRTRKGQTKNSKGIRPLSKDSK